MHHSRDSLDGKRMSIICLGGKSATWLNGGSPQASSWPAGGLRGCGGMVVRNRFPRANVARRSIQCRIGFGTPPFVACNSRTTKNIHRSGARVTSGPGSSVSTSWRTIGRNRGSGRRVVPTTAGWRCWSGAAMPVGSWGPLRILRIRRPRMPGPQTTRPATATSLDRRCGCCAGAASLRRITCRTRTRRINGSLPTQPIRRPC